jgi:hypothetical protein
MVTRKNITIALILFYWLISIFFTEICSYFEILDLSITNTLSLFFLPPFLIGGMLGVIGGKELMFLGHFLSLYLMFTIVYRNTKLLN